LIVSWGYHATPQSSSGSQFLDYLVWSGTKDPAASLSVPAAIQFMQEHHWDQVRRECHVVLRQALQRISELVQMEPLYPLESDLYAQMGIAPLPPATDVATLKSRLYDEQRVEVPMIEWPGRDSSGEPRQWKFVRVSVQGYNTPDDLDALCNGLEKLLPQVQ
jgi:isopenicillin-N epimerase